MKPQDERRCKDPYLIGRLSGQALSKLKWTQHSKLSSAQNENNSDVLIGEYKVFEGGEYYLEIIVISCLAREYNSSQETLMTCLEDPSRHRITAKGASISVEEDVVVKMETLYSNSNAGASSGASNNSGNITDLFGYTYSHDNSSDLFGYWYNTQQTVVPLYTRYQPQGCWNKDWHENCQEFTELNRFRPYKFRFTYKDINENSLNEIVEGKAATICYIGASHTRTNANKARIVEQPAFRTTSNITVQYLGVGYPNVATSPENLENIKSWNCSKILIGFGQHDASYDKNTITRFPDYEGKLRKLIGSFRDAGVVPRNGNGHGVDVYFRSVQ